MNKTTKHFKRIIGYTRKSIVRKGKSGEELATVSEADKHEFQIDKINELAAGRETLIFSESDLPRDTPMSKCPKLMDALSEIESGDLFVFWDQDRLCAGATKFESICELVKSGGGALYSLREQSLYDLDDEDAMFMYEFKALIANKEIRKTRRRVTQALASLKAKGKRTGHIPYGYQEVDGFLTINEQEAATIQVMEKLRYKEKLTYRDIAAFLNSAQIPKRSGCPWEKSAVHRILRNREKHNKTFPEHLQLPSLR